MVTGITAYKGGHQMNYNTVYVGMDVHKESFTFCAYTIDAEKVLASREQKLITKCSEISGVSSYRLRKRC